MSYFERPVLSNKAETEIAFAIANRLPIVFTRMALGSGRHTGDLSNVNDVSNHVMSIAANQSLEDVGSEIRVMGRLDNRNVTNTLYIREIGVFAKVGNRPEFVYMYTASDEADIVPPGTEASVIRDYTFNTRISDDGNLEIEYIIGEDVYGKYTEIIKVANDLQAHIDDKNNPHETNKSDVGLSNVDNIKQAPLSDFNAHKSATNPHNITKTTVGLGNVVNVKQASETDFNAHVQASNPHNINKGKVGLGNVDNFKTATQQEAIAGVAVDKFVTPFLVNAMLSNVVESGVGGTGNKQYWLRFRDGTQIIYGVLPPTRIKQHGVDVAWEEDFVRPFIDYPLPVAMGLLAQQGYQDSMGWSSFGQVTATYNHNYFWKHKFLSEIVTYPSSNVNLTIMLIGRWK